MKNRLIILICTVIITVITCSALFSVRAMPTSPEVNTNSSSNPQNLGFVLAAYGNNAALYDGNEIIEVYDSILISALPPADRTLLEQGIEISSFEQLTTLLEDFDG